MSLQVRKTEDGYTATGELNGVTFQTDRPFAARVLVRWLQDRGFHQTDIGDAFFEADPDWMSELDAK